MSELHKTIYIQYITAHDITWCQDRIGDDDIEYGLEAIHEAALAAKDERIKELEAQVRWVSVDDVLPSADVLGLYEDNHMNTVYCTKLRSGLVMWYACIDDDDIKAPTHWRPLPDGPKETVES